MFDGKYRCEPVLDSGLEVPLDCGGGGAPRLDGDRGGGGGGDESSTGKAYWLPPVILLK